MKILQNYGKIKLVVICCVHGDEIFGEQVFRQLQERINSCSGLRLILANEEALQGRVRFIDEDLNRCFPGQASGNHEQKLAAQLLPYIADAEYVLDIHTTTSNVQMTPIVTSLNTLVKHVINLTSSKEVVYMQPHLAKHSLIGQVRAGVSLEFGEQYAVLVDEALGEIFQIVSGLIHNRLQKPMMRKVFAISDTIPVESKLPLSAKNFHQIKSLGIYPFLLGEKSYTAHQGFAASSYDEMTI